MRKVTLGMNVSLDGFVAGPNGELDWVFSNVTPEQMAVVTKASSQADTMILGRNTYLEQEAAFSTQTNDLANMMNSLNKVVFSKTLDKVEWQNSRLALDSPTEEIHQLKKQPGMNIYVSGGSTLAKSFLELELIDELNLFVHPVILGEGKKIFSDHVKKQLLTLIESNIFPSGVVHLNYQKK
ncbi:dihydrofolate reductase family protein [Shimazuella kribbensis]|uniref:dihydrofolate reductase family protein n=1 Tax=Shimazuella kribbensis TaxID=139808 RepID=UPI000420BA3A|nr:dihydrofolate reductase family protein [Shimazuella kribbensis]